MKRFWRAVRKKLHELATQDTSSRSIAWGVAIGTFIGITPTFGFDVFVAIVVAFLVKHVNKIAILAGLAVWNPLVMLGVYGISFQIGNLFVSAPDVGVDVSFATQFYHYTTQFLIGNMILAVVVSVISYFVTKRIVESYRASES